MHTMLAAQELFDLSAVFSSAPIIYSLLSILSIVSMGIWLYSLMTVRDKEIMPQEFKEKIKALLQKEEYPAALELCTVKENLLSNILKTGLTTREFGAQVMLDAMKSEGKRGSTAFWQRLALLNDVVVIAPMLGLLGTVIGMFYAFYDVNRSIESINALFDGLGIAVGTTVMGLVVAIVAMIFHATLKYRVIQKLSIVENEALHLSALIRR